jgi:hypothetical protein
MNVRIRFPQGHFVRRQAGKNRQTVLAFGALMMPVSLMAYALGAWRFADDLGVAEEFGFTGILSHWQVWIGLGMALHAGSRALSRYGSGKMLKVPRVLAVFPSPPHDEPPSASPQRKSA